MFLIKIIHNSLKGTTGFLLSFAEQKIVIRTFRVCEKIFTRSIRVRELIVTRTSNAREKN